MGNAAGDPRYAKLEAQSAILPKIGVPTIVVHGADDEVNPSRKSEGHNRHFTGYYERPVFENAGHNPPQEDPKAFAEAALDLCSARLFPAMARKGHEEPVAGRPGFRVKRT
jgi:pimeloyl-ACP methyl ester carboxylesterase